MKSGDLLSEKGALLVLDTFGFTVSLCGSVYGGVSGMAGLSYWA